MEDQRDDSPKTHSATTNVTQPGKYQTFKRKIRGHIMPSLRILFRFADRWMPLALLEYRQRQLFERLCTHYPPARDIRDYFLHLKRDEQDIEIVEIIDYLKEYRFSIFPYHYADRIFRETVCTTKCYYDSQCKMHYVIHNGKRIYFPQEWDSERVIHCYASLCIEQDAASPHKYETQEYTVRDGDTIADIGAAEGIWALTYAEKAEKIYLFECEASWISALEKTFEPWGDKVIIVNKYVSDRCNENETTIDAFFQDKKIDFIKADIEGAETQLLQGGSKILSRDTKLKLLLCAYHRQNDATTLKEILDSHGFTSEFSNRYMLFILDDLKEPYIRRGLLRAKKG